ncbi:uncharacterized protein M6B38_382595 [Iris pallida]|uniref:Uncharacterized protein n=1 Tax=Iris pallida TaxID=29817 RepID=A0AAX6G6N6_IRIPA|nr:uncharacterized protein M6B38_382595 [Iris pallida]
MSSGVTGLSASEGKSRTLGESGLLAAAAGEFRLVEPMKEGTSGPIILRFFMLGRRSYSLKAGFLARLRDGIGWWFVLGLCAWLAAAARFAAVSAEPVSIWTTCLNDWVSAWTKVVG